MSDFIISIHCLVLLAYQKNKLNSKELAKNLCVNSVRIRTILNKFVEKGIITTKIGLNGGYMLVEKPNNISLLDIANLLDFHFIDNSWFSGEECDCIISSGMATYIKDLTKLLNTDISFVLEKITIEDVFNKLLKINEEKKAGN